MSEGGRKMSNGAIVGATAGASAAAAIAQAIKASGILIRVEPESFLTIISKSESPLIVMAEGGVFTKNYQYLTSYKGLAFYTKTVEQIQFPNRTELIYAQKIWIPG
jgi:hypothetical protein